MEKPKRVLLKEKKRQQDLLDSLHQGTSVFKEIPNTIGEIIWCDTKTTKNIFSDSISGVDYFVGTNGFAEIHFKKSRDNISLRKIYPFSLFKELVSKKTRIIINYTDQGEQRVLLLLSFPEDSYIANLDVDYFNHPERTFLDNIEDSWTQYKRKELQLVYKEKGYYPFSFVSVMKETSEYARIIEYFKIYENHFEINGVDYNINTLHKVKYKNGNLIIDLVDPSNSILKKVLGKNREEFDLINIGNNNLFIEFFNKTLAKMGHLDIS